MPLYTLEVAGEARIALSAHHARDAAAQQELLRAVLSDVCTGAGTPVLAEGDEVVARPATQAETTAWEADVARAVQDGSLDDRKAVLDNGWFVLLVPYDEVGT